MVEDKKIDPNIIKATLAIYGRDTIKAIVSELKSMNKKASGRLINSLKSDLKILVNSITLELSMEDYGQYVVYGRKPGKYAPPKAIEDWVKVKGIESDPKKIKSTSFLINRKIYRFGIKPADFITNALSDNNIDKLTSQMEDVYSTDLELQINNFFNAKT